MESRVVQPFENESILMQHQLLYASRGLSESTALQHLVFQYHQKGVEFNTYQLNYQQSSAELRIARVWIFRPSSFAEYTSQAFQLAQAAMRATNLVSATTSGVCSIDGRGQGFAIAMDC
jgi:hypothetical protein